MNSIGDAYFDRDIGQYLKSCRLAAGWSQAQVAELLGVTFQQVQKYESGTNRLPASRYAKLSKAIKFRPTAYLLGDRQSPDDRSDKTLIELLSTFRKLSVQDRIALLQVAQEMAGKTIDDDLDLTSASDSQLVTLDSHG